MGNVRTLPNMNTIVCACTMVSDVRIHLLVANVLAEVSLSMLKYISNVAYIINTVAV